MRTISVADGLSLKDLVDRLHATVRAAQDEGREAMSTEMMVYVAVRCEKAPTADQMSALTRNINGEIRHSEHTGLLEMYWRVPSERLLGVATTVPKLVSQTLTTAFRDEPEVVSLNVISMAKQ